MTVCLLLPLFHVPLDSDSTSPQGEPSVHISPLKFHLKSYFYCKRWVSNISFIYTLQKYSFIFQEFVPLFYGLKFFFIFALETWTEREKGAIMSCSLHFYFQKQLLWNMLNENTSSRATAEPPRSSRWTDNWSWRRQGSLQVLFLTELPGALPTHSHNFDKTR